jgi:hypothetical protein
MTTPQDQQLDQLQRALDAGLIDQTTFSAAAAAISAQLAGSGAIAEGEGAFAVGSNGVGVGGDNYGPINTGTQTIGRDLVSIFKLVTHGGEDPAEAQSVIALYLHALATDLAGLKLGEIDASADPARQTPLQLADIYVPLDTTLRIPKDTTLAECLSRATSVHEQRSGQSETQPVSALEALAVHRELTLLGKPPAAARAPSAPASCWRWRKPGRATTKNSLASASSWTHGALLPIRVILRRFAEQLPPATSRHAPATCGHSSPATSTPAATACRPTP